MRIIELSHLRILGALLLTAGLAGCGGAMARPRTQRVNVPVPVPVAVPQPTEGKHVVVDLDANQVRFMDGTVTLWSAPAGTGTGLRLKSKEGNWEFGTPTGVFWIQYKALNPDWVAPDWYFVEHGLPVPPPNSPKRRQPGGLGAAAVFLSSELAIHGTDKPELLGQRVSHGCIRLSDEFALRLFHNVQVGTPVVIRASRPVPPPDTLVADRISRRGSARPTPARPAAKPAVKSARKAEPSTAQLLARLDRQLMHPADTAGWAQTTGMLVARGLKDDTPALRGLLLRAGRPGDGARGREFATYLADLYSRGVLRTTVSLARIDSTGRARAADAIVEATATLAAPAAGGPRASWPTERVPTWRLGPEGRVGLRALREAEHRFKQRLAAQVAPAAPVAASRARR